MYLLLVAVEIFNFWVTIWYKVYGLWSGLWHNNCYSIQLTIFVFLGNFKNSSGAFRKDIATATLCILIYPLTFWGKQYQYVITMGGWWGGGGARKQKQTMRAKFDVVCDIFKVSIHSNVTLTHFRTLTKSRSMVNQHPNQWTLIMVVCLIKY